MTRICVAIVTLLAVSAPLRAAEPVDFAHQVVPILKKHCAHCHAGSKRKGGFSLNTRELTLAGGETGAAVVPGKLDAGELVLLITEPDPELRMPPADEKQLTPAQIELLKRWVAEGAKWEPGFTFGEPEYEAPLKPRRVEVPAVQGVTHPIDRLLAVYYDKRGVSAPKLVDDATFMRRLYLDLIGLLPPPAALDAFVADADPAKREKLVDAVLADDHAYAVHWMTFWNDLLRNDYRGTGYIDGGRSQITQWLYSALVTNKPYDQFVRELVAPTGASAGFINGIKWRGRVNASQTREIQFSQNISQVFLGINMKCASCHDSFIDHWKLTDAYALAAIVSDSPIEIHRCDKPTGETAKAGFIFPELGDIDPSAPRNQRLDQLAKLMTHPDNGRTTRTIVNRIWHRLMGRGIVHPVDAMGTEPWNADLLDYLAVHLSDQGYDVKQTIRLIATSRAYQSVSEVRDAPVDGEYVFTGPVARRMTAEQFLDGIWSITDTGPRKMAAPISAPAVSGPGVAPVGRWVWDRAGASEGVPAGESITLKRTFELPAKPDAASLVITCDNEYVVHINGKRVGLDDNWMTVERYEVADLLKPGANEIVIAARNAGDSDNPAAAYAELVARSGEAWSTVVATDGTWAAVAKDGKSKPAVEVTNQRFLGDNVQSAIAGELATARSAESGGGRDIIRAALVESDPLMRSLGRPNREQVVSVRPDELSTLQALDLSNGDILAEMLSRGAQNLVKTTDDPRMLINGLYRSALSREPTPRELAIAVGIVGTPMSESGVADLLWAVFMLPEYQLNR